MLVLGFKKVVIYTVQVSIFLQNMVVECHRDGYVSELFYQARSSVDNRMFVYENGEELASNWWTRATGTGG